MVRQTRQVSTSERYNPFPGASLTSAARLLSSAPVRQVVANVAAHAGKRAYDTIVDHAKKARSGKKKRKVYSRVLPDGTTQGTFRAPSKRSRKPKKKTLAARIERLEKDKGQDSQRYRLQNQVYKIPKNTLNTARIWTIRTHSVGDIETLIQNVGFASMNLDTQNTAVKIDLQSCTIEMKNAITGNVKLSYGFFKANDSTSVTPITAYKEAYQERTGAAPVNAESAATGATATATAFPNRLLLDMEGGEHNHGLSLLGKHALYSQVGKLSTVTLGPGDVTTCYLKKKPYIYKPEINDQNPGTYASGDIVFVCLMIPGLAHDQTNTDKVGYGLCAMDIEKRKRFMVSVMDGTGLREVSESTSIDSVGYSTPVAVDNHVSAVEIFDD